MSQKVKKAKGERGKDKRPRKKNPKGDDLVNKFYVEQSGSVPVAPAPISKTTTAKHNNSEEKDKGGRPTDYHPEYCEALIEHMGRGYSFESFAANLPPIEVTENGKLKVVKRRVSASTLYVWTEENVEFSEAKKIGVEACRYFWETMGIAGASGGMKGFNNITWLFNMKNRFRKEWKDRHELNVKGQDNAGQQTLKAVVILPSNGREKKPAQIPETIDITPKKGVENES